MAEYIYAVAGAVLLGELLLMLMPDGTLKSFAKMAVGVVLMLTMLGPLSRCAPAAEFSFREDPAPRGNTRSYSDIIMNIYTQAMDSAQEESDGKTTAQP